MYEYWNTITNFSDYEISSLGRVKSKTRHGLDGRFIQERILKPNITKSGYKFVILRKDGLSYNEMIHRLVANEFLENPMNKKCVNHIDGNKENNITSNLEWVTHHENRIHANKLGLTYQRGIPKECRVITPDRITMKFETISDVNKFFGFKKCWVQNRVRNYGNPFVYDGFSVEVVL
jgi:hypothetical protein